MFEQILNGVFDPETVHLGVLTLMVIIALVAVGATNPDFNHPQKPNVKPSRPDANPEDLFQYLALQTQRSSVRRRK